MRELRKEVAQSLRPFGFAEEQERLWKDGGLTGARLEVSADSFPPGRGRILLAGDAALMQLTVSGEGIGTALNSGRLAAQSVAEAMASGRGAAEIYLRQLEPLLNSLTEVNSWQAKIEEAGKQSPRALLTAFADGLRATLEMS